MPAPPPSAVPLSSGRRSDEKGGSPFGREGQSPFQPAPPAPQGNVPSPRSPLHAKFARLTQQEEAAGLLQTRGQGSSIQEPSPPSSIGTRTGWLVRLQEKGYTLRGHRLIKLSTAKAEIP